MTLSARMRALPLLIKCLVGLVLCLALALTVWLLQPESSAKSPSANPQPSNQENPSADPSSSGVPTPPIVVSTLPKAAPVACPAPGITVTTKDELTAALAAARPGTSIMLKDGTYTGAFAAAGSGTADRPIWLCGGRGAILDGGGIEADYVLHLRSVAFWRVVGFTVRNGQKGVVADATASSVLQGLDVHDIGDEGIHLRATSTGNAVLNNQVHATGLRNPKFGEGIYVGSAKKNMSQYSLSGPDRSDHNLIAGNTIHNTSAESIDIKEGTSGGLVRGNTFDGTGMTGGDSWVDVKGNGWVIENNVGTASPADGFQTHEIIDGWGTKNTFRNNTVKGVIPGLGINLAPVRANVITCSNHNADGSRATANVKCAG